MRCVTLDTNATNKISSQYKLFNYSSMRKFGDQYIAVNETGFYVIGGDTDDGVDIGAWIKTGLLDLGNTTFKRLRFLYLTLETNGDLEVEITADEDTVKTYDVPAAKVKQQRIRVPLGRDQRGVHWSFKIKNKKGAKFSLDSISVLPVNLAYGHI